MRDVPYPLRVRAEGPEAFATYDWPVATGAVYLLNCESTGEWKFGASVNPDARILYHIRRHKFLTGRVLKYVWSIATNGVGRLETYWLRQWKRFRIDKRKEWVRLPEVEVASFRSTHKFLWSDLPKPNPEWWECVTGPFVR